MLISQRRGRSHFVDELQEFLGNDTETFVDWLCEYVIPLIEKETNEQKMGYNIVESTKNNIEQQNEPPRITTNKRRSSRDRRPFTHRRSNNLQQQQQQRPPSARIMSMAVKDTHHQWRDWGGDDSGGINAISGDNGAFVEPSSTIPSRGGGRQYRIRRRSRSPEFRNDSNNMLIMTDTHEPQRPPELNNANLTSVVAEALARLSPSDLERIAALKGLSLHTTKIKTKCAKWPNCPHGEACRYIHPSEVCTSWPRCNYGSGCFYIHPQVDCKFGLNCHNEKCNFVHPIGWEPSKNVAKHTLHATYFSNKTLRNEVADNGDDNSCAAAAVDEQQQLLLEGTTPAIGKDEIPPT